MLKKLMITTASLALLTSAAVAQAPDQVQPSPPAATVAKAQVITEQKPDQLLASKFKGTNESYRYTVAHWCATEARFRNHLKKIKKEDAAKLISLENMLVRITQQDVVYRRYLAPDHRSYVPDFGVYIRVQGTNGVSEYRSRDSWAYQRATSFQPMIPPIAIPT